MNNNLPKKEEIIVINENDYNQKLVDYIQNGVELSNLTEQGYRVTEFLSSNEINLRGLLLSSDLCKELNNRNINYTLSDLKAYSHVYGQQKNVDMTIIEKAIAQLEATKELEIIEEKNIERMTRSISGIIGKETLSKYKEIGTVYNNSEAILELESKTPEELEIDRKKALEKAEELYTNDGVLDLESKQRVTAMITKIFNNHSKGSGRIPSNMIKQIEDSYQEEMTENKSR